MDTNYKFCLLCTRIHPFPPQPFMGTINVQPNTSWTLRTTAHMGNTGLWGWANLSWRGYKGLCGREDRPGVPRTSSSSSETSPHKPCGMFSSHWRVLLSSHCWWSTGPVRAMWNKPQTTVGPSSASRGWATITFFFSDCSSLPPPETHSSLPLPTASFSWLKLSEVKQYE